MSRVKQPTSPTQAVARRSAEIERPTEPTAAPSGAEQSMSNLDADKVRVFAGRANPQLAQRICEYLQIPLGRAKAELFPDGELIVKVDEDVRGRDCFIIQPTSHPVNAHLMELFIWIDTLRRASASRVTAVIPYFGYARQDRKDEGRTPITAKLVANLLERAGADRMVAVDLHAAQVQGFFDIPVDHLYAAPVFVSHYRKKQLKDLVVVAPDVGSAKMARGFAKRLNGTFAIIDKRRPQPNVAEVLNVVGEVEGRDCLIPDDMIDTAGTVTEAARALKGLGAKDIYVCATHALLSGPAAERLRNAPIKEVTVTDTVAIPEGHRFPQLTILSVGELLAKAIRYTHSDESVSSLFE
jgi:ribose-phosphate pyrophosphokinase